MDKDTPLMSLADIATLIQYGYTASASDTKIGPKFLRITDIVPLNIEWDTVPYCKIDETNFSKFSLKRDDIVIARTGATVGYSKLIRDNKSAVFASYLVRIRINSDIADPGYVGRIIESKIYKCFVLSRVGGSAQPNANAKVLSSFMLPIPAKSIQISIASTLSAYDDLIENNHRRIKLLEEAAHHIYKEWFIRLRFPGHEHTKITNGVPEGWATCGMMEHPYFEFIRENIGIFDGLKCYYATADISDISITGKGINYSFDKKPSRAQKAPETDSVWFARMQETYKVLVFTQVNHDLTENSMLSSGFAGFRAREPEFLPFLYFSINNTRFHEEKNRFCSGSTQRSLTDRGLKSIRTLMPEMSVVTAFAELTSPIIDQILSLQTANQKLTNAHELLLPRLMNGAINTG